jgi:hypothetical protein
MQQHDTTTSSVCAHVPRRDFSHKLLAQRAFSHKLLVYLLQAEESATSPSALNQAIAKGCIRVDICRDVLLPHEALRNSGVRSLDHLQVQDFRSLIGCQQKAHQASIAQLGERQTEDLKAPYSIHGRSNVYTLDYGVRILDHLQQDDRCVRVDICCDVLPSQHEALWNRGVRILDHLQQKHGTEFGRLSAKGKPGFDSSVGTESVRLKI